MRAAHRAEELEAGVVRHVDIQDGGIGPGQLPPRNRGEHGKRLVPVWNREDRVPAATQRGRKEVPEVLIALGQEDARAQPRVDVVPVGRVEFPGR